MLMIILLTIVMLLFLGAALLYLNIKNKPFKFIFHDILSWHEPDGNIQYDGNNITSTCKICKHKIMQDSQGNWFKVD